MLSYPFPPAMSAGVFRILRFCKYLPEFGWEPIVLTPRPEAVYPITVDPTLDALIPPGLEVHRTALLRPILRAKAGAGRIRNLLRRRGTQPPPAGQGPDTSRAAAHEPSGSRLTRLQSWERRWLANPDRHVGWLFPAVREGLRIIRSKRPEVIYSTGPPHSSHLIAMALKRLTGVPIVLDFRDPWAAREWGAASRPTALQRSALRWEARCVRGADRVVLNTTAVKRQFETTYAAANGKFTAIPNGLDRDFVQRIQRLVVEAAMDVDGAIRLCHAGSVYGRRDLRPLAAAIELIAASGQTISMEQIGPVDPRRQPRSASAGEGSGHLRLLGSLPHEPTLQRMAAATVLVMIQPDNTLQIPGKLYEMLPFRKPILTLTGPGATADVVEQFGLGPVVDPNDPEAIAAGIRRAGSAAGREAVTQGIERAMQAFDGRTLTRQLADQFAAAAR